MPSPSDARARIAQVAWLRRRSYLWLFWSLVGLAMLLARFFVLPHFDVASYEWPNRTLVLALVLLVGGGIQYKLTSRRADAIDSGLSAGEAFTSIKDESPIAPLAEAAENVADIASEL